MIMKMMMLMILYENISNICIVLFLGKMSICLKCSKERYAVHTLACARTVGMGAAMVADTLNIHTHFESTFKSGYVCILTMML